MNKSISYPERYEFQIKKSSRGYPKKYNVIGADVETKPYKLLGMGNGDNVDILPLSVRNFIILLEKYVMAHNHNVCYFHNLKFDMQVIFRNMPDIFLDHDSAIIYLDSNYRRINDPVRIFRKDYRVRIKLYHGKTWFMKIRFSKNKNVEVLDSYALLKGSLKNLSYTMKLKHKKYEIDFDNATKDQLKRYLIQDVKAVYSLGKRIADITEQYNVPFSVSIAQLSQRIFKRRFLREKDLIPNLPEEFLGPAIRSYHGGKNTYIHDRDMVLEGMNFYDINSLYPFCMTQIPNFLNCEYLHTNSLIQDYIGEPGIYRIHGLLKKDTYACLYSHDFERLDLRYHIEPEYKKPLYEKIRSFSALESYLRENDMDVSLIDREISLLENIENLCIMQPEYDLEYVGNRADTPYGQGYANKDNTIIDLGDNLYLNGLWVTSYELDMALKHELFHLDRWKGIIVHEREGYNPLNAFVQEFYDLKSLTSKDHPNYLFYKLILNSLYGKFIQHIPLPEGNVMEFNHETGRYVKHSRFIGGGLFNPLLASLITGYSRAVMFDYEKEYESVHTATDSIITRKKIPVSKRLGGFSLVDSGHVIILRNKLYLFFTEKARSESFVMYDIKAALHGFHSDHLKLLSMYLRGEREYKAERFVNIREGYRRKDVIPCEFQELDYKLNI